MDMARAGAEVPNTDGPGRRYRRFELAFPVRMKIQSTEPVTEIEAVSKNVSIGGLLVRASLPVPEHTAVTFVLSVHGKQAVRPIHLIGEGEIVRVEREDQERNYVLAVKCNVPLAELVEFLPA